jgi:3-oxoacyl-[acyl-carrier protein] reductase
LEGLVALVTGAGQGIGRAIAVALSKRGAQLALADINEAGLVETGNLMESPYFAMLVDVSQGAAVAAWVAAAAGRYGQIDILVNNAGIFPRQPFMEMSESDWDTVLNVNLKGAFLTARYVAPYMSTAAGGCIINISSNAAFEGTRQGAHYASSKAGLLGLTRALALELAPYNINVNAIAPGLTDTAQPRYGATEEQIAAQVKTIPLGRIGKPEDVAGLVAWLCGPDATYISGQTFHVNGGAYRT